MKKVVALILGFLLFIAAGIGILRFVVGGEEDTWICIQGEWLKHGNPSKPIPTSECGE